MPALRSMTGFARVRRVGARGEMTMTIKSVNHRSLDVHLHLPADCDAYENAVRAAVKQKASRGHIDVRLVWNRTGAATPLQLNRPLLEAWHAAFNEARATLGVESQPDLNAALRLAGMLAESDGAPDSEIEGEIVSLAAECADQFNASREKEGASLTVVIRQANARIQAAASELATLREQATMFYHQRLQERLAALLAGSSLDPQRVAQEAALLADRSDVTEEIHRLTIHSKQLDELLDKGGEVGKKLDFLMQEMGRESNTILSKSSAAGDFGLRITDLGLAVKSEIERIREQALNLE